MSFLSSLQYTYERMGEPDRALEMEAKVMELDTTGRFARGREFNKMWAQPTPKKQYEAAEKFLEKYPKDRMRQYVYSMMFRFAQMDPRMKNDDVEQLIDPLDPRAGPRAQPGIGALRSA